MRLRRTTLEDVESLLEIERLSFKSSAFSRRSILYHVRNNLVICAESKDKIVGYICLSPLTKRKRRRVYSIAVHPDHRKIGVAESLMVEAERKSKSREIYLEVDETNAGAIRLYTGLGYETFGRYVGYYGSTDALRMKKFI